MVGVETRAAARETAARTRRKCLSSGRKKTLQVAVTKGSHVLSGERLRILSAVVDEEPERVARHPDTQRDRELHHQMIEPATTHEGLRPPV